MNTKRTYVIACAGSGMQNIQMTAGLLGIIRIDKASYALVCIRKAPCRRIKVMGIKHTWKN